MSAGRLCDCPRRDHEPVLPWHGTERDPLREEVEPGFCRRYAQDQERGGLCSECFVQDHRWVESRRR